jgi:hypothetical protein
MHMSNVYNGSFKTEQTKAPEIVKDTSRSILKNPFDVDLSQPDRAVNYSVEAITHSRDSKEIAEITIPGDIVKVILTPFGNFSIISLIGNNEDAFEMLEQGETKDLSYGEQGKCIVTFDESGKHLYVYATDLDDAYRISAVGDIVGQMYDAPDFNQTVHDPDMPIVDDSTDFKHLAS